jgi:hypothetical protein
MIRPRATAAALVLALWMVPGSAGGQEAAAPLSFRRIFVPEDALDSQIRGLLPLKREEFETRLQTSRRLREPAGPAQVRIDSASYRARYDQGQIVDGTATLDVTLEAAGPAVLPLSPCSLTIQSARWAGEDRRPATVGVDPAGALVCVVERSGRLELTWSQRGHTAVDGAASFDLLLPPAPQCRLELESPAEYRLESESGLLTGSEPVAGNAGSRIWTFELGGSSQARLAVRRDEPAADDGSLVVVRESATYSVLAASVDMEVTLTLDILHQPLQELVLLADPGLKVTSIRVADQALAWSQQAGASAADPQRLAVALESPLHGIGRALQISATADWPDQRRWSLPRIRAAGGKWQEGRVTVAAPTWLRLEAQPLAGCERTAVLTADAGRTEDQFQFQLFAEDAAIEIAGDPHAAPLRERSGTEIRIDASQVSGVMIAELASLGGERFSVDAVLPRHWLIDTVEMQPAEMLADRSTTPRGPGQQALRLNLTRSLNESRPLKVIIRAHYRRPAAQQPLTAEFFRLASFPDAREARRLTCVRVSDPAAELRLSGDEQLARLAPAELPQADLRLFEMPPSGLVFDASGAVESLRGQLAPTAPRYRADVVVQARAEREQARQTVSIRCQPQASAVQSLLVRLAPRPLGDITWRLVGEEARGLTAAPVVEAGLTSGDDAIYRLTLARPRGMPFEVRGEMAAAPSAEGGHELSVAWLPEASSQTGLVEVFADQGGRYSVVSREMERLPAGAGAAERFTPLLARFRYEAGRRASLRVAPVVGPALAAAWIESLHLTSHFSVAGEGDHEVALQIANAGLKELRLRLPAHVAHLRLHEKSAGLLTRTTAGGAVIALPPGERRVDVGLRYSTSASAPGVFPLLEVTTPVPQFDVPVFSQSWDVAVAPGLAAFAAPVAPTTIELNSDATWTGWTCYRPALDTGNARLAIYRPAMFRVWAICLGLATAACGFLSRWRANNLLPLAGLCCAGGLLLAEPWAWLVLAAALGLTAVAIAKLIQPRREAHVDTDPATMGSTIVLAAGQGSGAVLLAVLLMQAEPVSAQPAESPKYRRVVIPVDEDREPVGDYVFVEPELYESLHKLTAAGPSLLPAWLLTSARYEVAAGPRSSDGAAAVEELRVQLDLETFQSTAEVVLPLRRDQVSLVEGRARLNGQPLVLNWAQDGRSLKFTAHTPGRQRLELTLGAALRREASSWQLDLSIPAAAQASLVLPPGAVEVFDAAWSQPFSEVGGLQTLFLGAVSRLRIRWPDAAASPNAADSGEVEQLLWWRVRPGSVVLDGRFVIRPASAPVRDLLVAVDPRLRLISPVGGTGGGPISRVAPLEGAGHIVRVELAEPASREMILKLSWLWTDAGGAGTLLLPSVAVREQRIRRSWMAVTVDPGYSAEWESPPLTQTAATPADFVSAWGELPSAPTLVRDATLPSPPLVLRVVPRQRDPQVKQMIDWCLSATDAEARLSLKLTEVPPARLMHRLTLPPQLKVQSVALLEQSGRPTQIRWSQQADGLLSIQLLEASAPEQQLTVVAKLPVARGRQRLQLPAVRLAQATLGASRMRIFRRQDVQLALIDPAGWTRQDDAPIGQYVSGLGRLVAELASGSSIGDTQPRLSRSVNHPRLSGSLQIQVQEDDGSWLAETRLDLAVTGGLLDEVWLSIPAEWSGPLTIQQRAGAELANVPEHQVLPIPGELRRHLLIRPLKAVKDRLELTISGPLASGASGMEAPDVSLLADSLADEGAVRRLVLLDTRAGAEQIEWETTGLLAMQKEDQTLPVEWQAADGQALLVVAPRFSAKAKLRASAVTSPQVLLAETAARLGASRHVALTSTFTIEPNGAADATFTLPPGWRLIQAQLDGALADARPAGLRTWRVAAPSTSLPYRLTIVADGRLPLDGAGEGRFSLAAPQVLGMATKHSAWIVAGGPYRAAAAGGQRLRSGAMAELALLRLETAAAGLSEVADAVANELPTKVQAEAFRAWWHDFQAAAGRLATLPATAERTQRRAVAEQAAERARQRMLAGGLLEEDDLVPATPAVEPAKSMLAESCYVADGDAHAITLVAASPPPIEEPSSAGWAAALAALSLASLVVLPQPRVRDWLAVHAALLVAAAGIVWWLVAPWGVAGWLLVAAAVWLSLRWTWPRGGYEPSAASW